MKNRFLSSLLLITLSVILTSCNNNSPAVPANTASGNIVSSDVPVSGDAVSTNDQPTVSGDNAADGTDQDVSGNPAASKDSKDEEPRIKSLRHTGDAGLSELSSMAYRAMFDTLCSECKLPYDHQKKYDDKYGEEYFKKAIKRFTIEDVDDDGMQEFVLVWRAHDTKDMMGVVYSYSDYNFKWSLKREGILIKYEDYADEPESGANDQTNDSDDSASSENVDEATDSDKSKDDNKEDEKEEKKDKLPYIELAHQIYLDELYRLSSDNADALIKLKDGTLSSEEIHVFRDVAGNNHIEIINGDAKPARISTNDYKLTENGIEITGTGHRLGIDVSFYQDNVDFEKVKNSGFDFVFIRAGFRGYGTGSLNEDSKAVDNIKNALAAGLDVGVYFFSQAINEKEAVEEAEYVFDILEKAGVTSPEELKMPIVFDPESIMNDSARTDGVTGEQFTLNSIAFCETVKEKGYEPCVYCNMLWQAFKLDLGILKDYKIWYADYEELPQTPYDYSYWQYSDTGHVDGVKGSVDLDIEILYD